MVRVNSFTKCRLLFSSCQRPAWISLQMQTGFEARRPLVPVLIYPWVDVLSWILSLACERAITKCWSLERGDPMSTIS